MESTGLRKYKLQVSTSKAVFGVYVYAKSSSSAIESVLDTYISGQGYFKPEQYGDVFDISIQEGPKHILAEKLPFGWHILD